MESPWPSPWTPFPFDRGRHGDRPPHPADYFRLAFHFGLFQFLMPVIGYCGGVFVER
jgi:putative Mn2+ efflux pump MntP